MNTSLRTATADDLSRELDRHPRGVQFQDHQLPPGCRPSRGRVGVEASPQALMLHVDRSITYHGSNRSVADWVRTGTRRFDSGAELLDWFAACVGEGRPEGVTDLTAVRVHDHTPTLSAENLADAVRADVIGQDEVVTALAGAVARHAGKRHPRKPASAMLLGPTGVGKTLAAQTTAVALTALSGDDWAYHRIDMSEYSESHATARIVGAPPGYLGHGQPNLATRIAAHPRSVVLFDEIEKAHPNVLRTLMNLMDAGRLETPTGSSITAPQAVLLFTSNLGSQDLAAATSRDPHDADRAGREHLLAHGMAPEITARFGLVCIFAPLTVEALARVAAASVLRVAAEYEVHIAHVHPDYLTELLTRSRGNNLGVRALEHLVEAGLGANLAAHTGTIVNIDADGGVISVHAC